MFKTFRAVLSSLPLFMLLGTTADWAGAAELKGIPLDETYRSQFGDCDNTDKFEGVQFPVKNKQGKVIWYGCKSDPSRFTRFESLESADKKVKAVLFESKIARDDDGSPQACSGAKGPTDQCPTSLMLDQSPRFSCVLQNASNTRCVPVDSASIPFIVIPAAAPKGIDPKGFSKRTNIAVGDYGVVLYGDKVVPVIVADEGPAYKIGEGSRALLEALSGGKAKTRAAGVKFVVFPGSRDARSTLKLETLKTVIQEKGCGAYSRLVGQKQAMACGKF